ncbi:MAG TPA: ABC transporter substrate-binding protein [Streptosporangiaceae bacterium]|nr:ABC transporter substrate-binding protein [Streptosporangiaceae bacterium]
MNLKTPRLYAAALLALATCLVAACASNAPAGGSGGTSAAAAPATLKVELDWVPNPDHVGLYYAQNKGIFAHNNLTVNFLTPSNAADPIKLVGLNKVDLAISYESEMFYGQQENLPVTAVATVIPVPLNSLIVTPKDHVTSLSQMAGKKVGITGIPSDGAIYATMLKAGGLTPSQVTSVTVGFNLVPSVLSGKVDAIIGGYRNVEAIQIAQEMGQKPSVFPASALGVPSYAELVLVANRNRLASDKAYANAVRRFVKSLVAGTNGALKDPSGTTQIMEQVSQYKVDFLKVSVPYTTTLLKPPAGTKTGCINVANWQSFGNWMKQNKLIKITPNASLIATDKYMPYSCSTG